jgi:hypothetical protein
MQLLLNTLTNLLRQLLQQNTYTRVHEATWAIKGMEFHDQPEFTFFNFSPLAFAAFLGAIY